MTSGITGRITGVLFHPTETFADTIRSDTLKDTLIYLLILVVIFTVFSAALLLVGVSVYAGLATGIAAGGLSVIALIPPMLFFGGGWWGPSSLPPTCISGSISPVAEKGSPRPGRRSSMPPRRPCFWGGFRWSGL
ncbi:hypothetical protein [Methanogenium cariaci]|uniref:hypothetical protein n=1 Tax=Methanogenium cariaci TaxID=2197 RepID=UPI001FE20B65|nr:hypothetical protein [Methanogenium cariaci]